MPIYKPENPWILSLFCQLKSLLWTNEYITQCCYFHFYSGRREKITHSACFWNVRKLMELPPLLAKSLEKVFSVLKLWVFFAVCYMKCCVSMCIIRPCMMIEVWSLIIIITIIIGISSVQVLHIHENFAPILETDNMYCKQQSFWSKNNT